MVQSSDPRNRDDLTNLTRFGRPLFGSILLKPEVRAIFVVVGDIRSNYSAELRLIDRDHVVEAFFPEAANPSFGISVLPRRSKSCTYLFESKPINPMTELCPIDLVIITNQESPGQIERAGFDYLLGGPLRGRMSGHVEMKNSPPLEAQDKEHVENAKRRRGDDSEINCKGLV